MTIAFSPSVWADILGALSLSRQRWVQSVADDLSDANVDSESSVHHALDVALSGMHSGDIVRALIELALAHAPGLDIRRLWKSTLVLVDSRDWGSDPIPEIALIRAGIQWAQVEAPNAVEFDVVWLIAAIESPISFVPSSSRSRFSAWGLFGNPASRRELLAELWRLDVTWQDVSGHVDDVSVLRDRMVLVHSSAGGLSARQWVRLAEFAASRITTDAAALRLAVTQACEIATSSEESRDHEWGRRITERLRGAQESEGNAAMLRDALRALHPALFAELQRSASSSVLTRATLQPTTPEPCDGDDSSGALEASRSLVSRGKHEKAISQYRALVEEHAPVDGIPVKLRNLVTGERSKAIATYARLARRYAEEGAFANAVALYNEILEIDASDIDSRFQLALMYEHLDLVAEALSTYDIVARSHSLAGQLARATEPLGRMASLDPESVNVRIRYAEALSKASRIEDAANEFLAAAELLRSQGRMDDYIKVAERLLFHRHDLAMTREVAELYLMRNDARRALSKLQASLQANPKDVSTLKLVARAFHMLGETPKTIRVYREIARLYHEAKRPDERLRHLRKILELDPNDAEARVALGITPAHPPRRSVSSLPGKSPEALGAGGSPKARALAPFGDGSGSSNADDLGPTRPSTPEPTEGDVTKEKGGASGHPAGEQRYPHVMGDGETRAVVDEEQDRPRYIKDAPATLRGAAPITLLTGDRTRTRKASLALDLESYMSAVRQSVVSDSMHNELDAHSARVQAALQMTQVAEQVLQRRLSDFRTNHRATAKEWAPIVGALCDLSVREKVFGDAARKQRAFHAKRFAQAMEGADMSLGVMSGWFRPTWRIEPEIIARAIQEVVGIPDGAEEMVFRLGAVRNVLAHRHEYERKAHRSLGPTVGWLCRTRIAGREVIDVPLQCFDEMDSLVARLIERGE
ncbi:MAG: hypothetical protein H6716_23980 [Polyangiaceae bacterium]|nr:hypothetical protein [Polyangiaceae bacterium]